MTSIALTVSPDPVFASGAPADTPTGCADASAGEREATTHALRRTSPTGKGMKFIGTCILCGTPNLPSSAALEPCLNQRGLTGDEALIEVIEGDEP